MLTILIKQEYKGENKLNTIIVTQKFMSVYMKTGKFFWKSRTRKKEILFLNMDARFSGEDDDLLPVCPAEKPTSLIMFTCLQCGGALKITEATPRILSCEYCSTDQYMPDTLWKTLHPIPKKRAWFIRWA
ncbi:MAG: hypothetical protein ABUK01_06925 [Leptospirales bacterium]